MKGLNWGTYGEAEANRMAKGLQTLSEKLRLQLKKWQKDYQVVCQKSFSRNC